MKLSQRLAAEGLGSLLLAATVIGSGIMAQRLAAGNTAVALLANTGATVAVLAALIALLAPVSGAHFNPAVSLIEGLRGALSWRETAWYVLLQVVGCCLGAVLAHAMFELPWLQSSLHVRTGPAQWLAESVATFGLLLIVLGRRRAQDAPWMDSQPNQLQQYFQDTSNCGDNCNGMDILAYAPGGRVVPEPTTLGLLGIGLAGIGFMRKRRIV